MMAEARVTIPYTEQRAFIKISVLLGKSASQINDELKEACGDFSLQRSSVFEWSRQFKDGRTSIEDKPRSGRPISTTDDNHVEGVAAEIAEDTRLTCEQIGYIHGINRESVHRILVDHLGKRKVAARFVPHFLSDVKK